MIDYARLPLLLTDIEAATVLRLTDDAETPELAVKRLTRIVESGRLRPAVIGKHRRFSIRELTRFIDAETEARGEVR